MQISTIFKSEDLNVIFIPTTFEKSVGHDVMIDVGHGKVTKGKIIDVTVFPDGRSVQFVFEVSDEVAALINYPGSPYSIGEPNEG